MAQGWLNRLAGYGGPGAGTASMRAWDLTSPQWQALSLIDYGVRNWRMIAHSAGRKLWPLTPHAFHGTTRGIPER